MPTGLERFNKKSIKWLNGINNNNCSNKKSRLGARVVKTKQYQTGLCSKAKFVIFVEPMLYKLICSEIFFFFCAEKSLLFVNVLN